MFILEQRQLETKWAQRPPPAARSGSLRKAKALIRAAEGRFECVCPAQALQSAGVREQRCGLLCFFPRRRSGHKAALVGKGDIYVSMVTWPIWPVTGQFPPQGRSLWRLLLGGRQDLRSPVSGRGPLINAPRRSEPETGCSGQV